MYKNVIDPGKSVSFVLNDIDISGQTQYRMCTGSLAMEGCATLLLHPDSGYLKFCNNLLPVRIH